MRALLLLAFAATLAMAESITWTGYGGDNQWTNKINWNPDKVPGENDDVTIGTGNVYVTVPTGVNSLVMGTQVSGYANLTLYQSFVVGNGGLQVEENGNLIINTGLNTVFASATIGGNLMFVDGVLGGAWTVNSRAFADLGNANEKGFSGATFVSQGQLSLGGVIVLNQSSTVTLQSNTMADSNLFIQNGDGSGVSFDASAATFTFSTGMLQVQAPMKLGQFVLQSGNMTVLDSLTFNNALNVPQGSYVVAAGNAVLNVSAGLTGNGVVSVECTRSNLYDVSFAGDLNALGGDVIFQNQADMGVLTVKGANVVVLRNVYPTQLNLLGGTTSGSGAFIAANVLVSTNGLTHGCALTANKTMTWQQSVFSFAPIGAVTVASTATATVTGAIMLTGAPNGKGVTNNGQFIANAAVQSQNIPIAGSGSFTVTSSLAVSQIQFSQSSVVLSGSAVFAGANSFLTVGAIKNQAGGVVKAIIGDYTFQCPGECDHVNTPNGQNPPTSKFEFSA